MLDKEAIREQGVDEQALRDALAQGLSGRDAVKRVSEQCKVPKNQVYACYTSLTD